jgi:hypothetical protein
MRTKPPASFDLTVVGTSNGQVSTYSNILWQMRAMQRLKAVEWEMRLEPLEDLLEAYKERHNACVNSKTLPGKYLVVRFEDKDAGIGNQLPSVVSGVASSPAGAPRLPSFDGFHTLEILE